MRFVDSVREIVMGTKQAIPNDSKHLEVATLGGGCFWCTEAAFSELAGVVKVEPGYAGGHFENSSYEDVCYGETGHAEVVQVTFDPEVLPYRDLLQIFFSIHDPSTLNRQGADMGTQYRSIILYHSETQKQVAEQVIRELNAEKVWPSAIVTQVVPFDAFYAAEEYHREYFRRNPKQAYCQVVIAPKLKKLREHYKARLRSQVA